MKPKIIYVAGPIRGDVEGNVKRAVSVATKLGKAGVPFICVHANVFQFMESNLPESYWLKADLDILARCDAIQLVSGWMDSSGTIGEVQFAQQNDIPVFGPSEVGECIRFAIGDACE